MADKKKIQSYATPSSPLYGLGFIGAIFYYFQQAEGFGNFVMGFLKALVWPAVVVYRLLESLAS